MFSRPASVFVALFFMINQSAFAKADPLCVPLQEFVNSVKKNEVREIVFHTIWGDDFKDTVEKSFGPQKRCAHEGYEPGQHLCSYLIEHGAAEFPHNNLRRSILCLSPKSSIDKNISFNNADIHLSYGDDENRAFVRITFGDDQVIGGVIMRIKAEGY